MSEHVVITASIWQCDNFIPPREDAVVPLQKVFVVLAPINVDNLHGHTTIGWACSCAASCGNARCRYAKG